MENRIHEFNKEDDYIIICCSGNRSNTACQLLNAHSVNVTNVAGGMIEWNRLQWLQLLYC
ncbi:rhodanese-like domain-containing protein [Macrococcus equipercicus]|uniref:Rhodanese-like domain-containing protein n=1 Tax=Macrococcus equipercicus TaxID=69967 RepID=A0A9Q9BSA7_9STAP|nr:rhodanese-like domain-containing protein [Macrococcus equipercicus]UTH14809.1 rhodanese-like domain-containing protein [Macrococcus equipercicus]